MVKQLLAILAVVLYVSTASSRPCFIHYKYDDKFRFGRPCFYRYPHSYPSTHPYPHYPFHPSWINASATDDMDEVLLSITKPSEQKADVSTVDANNSQNLPTKVDEKKEIQKKSLSDITAKDGADKSPHSTPEPSRKDTDILSVNEDNSGYLSEKGIVEELNKFKELLKALEDILKGGDFLTVDADSSHNSPTKRQQVDETKVRQEKPLGDVTAKDEQLDKSEEFLKAFLKGADISFLVDDNSENPSKEPLVQELEEPQKTSDFQPVVIMTN